MAIKYINLVNNDEFFSCNDLLGNLHKFYNGFFSEKELSLPHSIKKSNNKIEIKISITNYPTNSIKLTHFENILIFNIGTDEFLDSRGHEKNELVTVKDTFKKSYVEHSWRLPPNAQKVSSTIKDGILLICINLDENHLVNDPYTIDIKNVFTIEIDNNMNAQELADYIETVKNTFKNKTYPS